MNSLKWSLCVGVAALALIPAVAAAQDVTPSGGQNEPSGARVEEVVVTAQKRAENLQQVPIAVAAFSASTLQGLGAVNTKDLQTLVPGVVFTQNQNSGNIYVRGVGANNGTIGQESPV